MVDVGRNPHSLESLKETIDLLWFYKVDSMQLHLTDDQRYDSIRAFNRILHDREHSELGYVESPNVDRLA